MPQQLVQFGPIILMFALLYFLIIRPQQRQKKEHAAMLGALKVGDKVVTIGGLLGTITNIKEDRIFLQVADNVEVKFVRSAISRLQATDTPAQPKEEKK